MTTPEMKKKLIADCITFLQDPRVTSSLEDHRVKYLQERMKLTDEEVEECFQGAYGHGTAAYEAAKNAKEAMLAEKKEADMAKKAAAKKSTSKGKASKSKSKSKAKGKATKSKAKASKGSKKPKKAAKKQKSK